MLIVKVIDCLQLSDTKTRDEEKWPHFQNAAFFEWINRLLKTWDGENDG